MSPRIDNTLFCTVITADYLPFAATLHASLQERCPAARMVALVAVDRCAAEGLELAERPGLSILYADDLHTDAADQAVHRKYFETDMDAFRWAAKPGLMKRLFEDHAVDTVVFCDCDLLFTGDVREALSELGDASMLLTPHWYDTAAAKPGGTFDRWFVYGIFNAGFVAASRSARPILDWWQEACLFACRIDKHCGMFVDQKYLDLLPVLFDGVRVSRNRRLNVGGWRLEDFLHEHGDVWPLPPEEAPVFLHFTCLDDIALPGPGEGVLADYSRRLQAHGLPYNLLERVKAKRRDAAAAAEALAAEREELIRRRNSLRGRLRRGFALGTRLRHLLQIFRPRPEECEW